MDIVCAQLGNGAMQRAQLMIGRPSVSAFDGGAKQDQRDYRRPPYVYAVENRVVDRRDWTEYVLRLIRRVN